jgi:FlaA1/EpsC-like NDP-sugar epimerase
MTTEYLVLRRRRAIVVVLHIIIVIGAYYLAFLLRFNGAIDEGDFELFKITLPLVAGVQLAVFIPFRLYRGLWRYIGIRDLLNIILATMVSSSICYVLLDRVLATPGYPRSIYIIDALLLVVLLGGARLARRLYRDLAPLQEERPRVLIIGAGDAGEMIVRDVRNNPFYNIEPIGFVDDDLAKVGRMIHSVPVLGSRRDLPNIIARHTPDEILVAICRAEPALLRAILRSLEPYRLPIRMLPNLRDVINGRAAVHQIRDIALEDLLQRGPVGLDPAPLRRLVEGRRVMVTGGGGSIGSELCRQLSMLNCGMLLLFERYENALYTIEADLLRGGAKNVVPLIGDVTDAARVKAVFEQYRPEIILHAAAHKHVPLVEYNPCEAVKNNVRGTRIVAQAAAAHHAERFILISTDKAVKPSSVMGATKRSAELTVKYLSSRSSTCFAIVRFGNVLGSNGSVVPKFIEQIRAGGPVTVTHPEVRRFFMTIPEAVNLVLHAATLNVSGAVYALDMGTPIKIVDMARHLIRLSGLIPDEDIQIHFTGLRAGEKLDEMLVDDTEEAQPSEIRQIFRVIGNAAHDLEHHYRELLRLEALSARGAATEVLSSLARIVPGFRSNFEIQTQTEQPELEQLANAVS